MSIQGKTAVGWRVVGHVTDRIIRDVSFTVKEPARLRVIRDKQKNVHAWGEGILIGHIDPTAIAPLRLSYDPYKDSTFVDRDTGKPVTSCSLLVVGNNKVFMSEDALSVEAPQRTQSDRIGAAISYLFISPYRPIAA